MMFPKYSGLRSVEAGAIGGLIGTLVLGVVTLLGQSSTNTEIFFITVARRLGMGSNSVVGGWGLHILTGVVAGSIFVGTTARVKQLGLTNIRKAVAVGVGAGITIWIVLFLPVTAILVPENLNGLVIGALIFHIIYGTITASIAFILLRRSIQAPAQM